MLKETTFIFLITLLSLPAFASRAVRDTTLNSLYQLMDEKGKYMKVKEDKINGIKGLFVTPNLTDIQRYDINHRLYDEYKVYISDSAIFYTLENLNISQRLEDDYKFYETKLDLVALYIVSGMYIEAIDILKSINRRALSANLLVKYYDCYKLLYNYYSNNNSYTLIHKVKSTQYRDSLLSVLNEDSNHYKIVYAEKLYDNHEYEGAKRIIHEILDNTHGDTHEKAVLAYALANIYKKENNFELERHYFAVSAICDIKNAIKENASMQALASILYELGDIEKAYECIKSSMEDAMFCNAKLRTIEVSQIFPIIDTAFQEKIAKQKKGLKFFLFAVSILSIFLILAILFVYKQMRKVARIRMEVDNANIKLKELNCDLQTTVSQLNSTNDELSEVNTRLTDTNQIKEAYIGHFLDLCSTYIDKLESFKNSLNRKASEKKLEELYKMLKSRDMIENELRELYENFDNIFLHLYPNFVEDFNNLLVEQERFVLKPNELLNVELRIFALVRLGISDSSKIAKFLRYSANTIYSYRTRVRNKSLVPRDEFELMVMKIGDIKRN